jgi:tagatose-1,6-bisphosphate aldolase
MAESDGIVVGVAVDHRESLRTVLRKDIASPLDDLIAAPKLRIIRALGSAATLVLGDAEYATAQAIAEHAVPGGTALARSLEPQGAATPRAEP